MSSKKVEEFPRKILVDTNFLISLVNKEDANHENAKNYFKKIIEDGGVLYISSIVWSELHKNRECIFEIIHNFKFSIFRRLDAEKVWEIFDKDEFSKSVAKSGLKDDYKIIAQALSQNFDAVLTADVNFAKIAKNKSLEVIDFNISVREYLGQLFP